jgi:hypothetical protein
MSLQVRREQKCLASAEFMVSRAQLECAGLDLIWTISAPNLLRDASVPAAHSLTKKLNS